MIRGDDPAPATLTNGMWNVYYAGCDGVTVYRITEEQ